MPKNKYYYYDQESCVFKEVEPRRSKRYVQGASMLAVSLVIAVLFAWAMDLQWVSTPQEAALKAENEALQEQMADAGARMESLSKNLNELAATDRTLYRKLLRADPISEDVRQVGVGGADPHEELDRFDGHTAELMRNTAQTLDRLERQMKLQNTSYRELTRMAEERRAELAHLPALLPADGPIVSGFGLRDHPILKVKKMHTGIDILVKTGTAVVAPGKGTVRRAGFSSSYGKVVEIEHDGTGYTTRYAHLSRIPERIAPGYQVDRGDTVAFSGSTGRVTGPHLHYEVRDTEKDRAINPVYFFAPTMTPNQYRKLLKEAEESGAALDY